MSTWLVFYCNFKTTSFCGGFFNLVACVRNAIKLNSVSKKIKIDVKEIEEQMKQPGTIIENEDTYRNNKNDSKQVKRTEKKEINQPINFTAI
jgi:hypothetical protein